MKKLSKIHIVLIVLLVAVVAGGAYFMSSSQGAEAKQPDIQQEITMALMRLETAIEENNVDALKEQLDKLQSEIHILSLGDPLFPEQPATVEIGDLIVDTVHKLDPLGKGALTLLKLNSDDKAGKITIDSDDDEETTGNEYSKAEYEIKVQGDLGRINSLIGEIEGAGFATLTIEDMEIEFHPEEKQEDRIIPAFWEAEFTVVTLYQCEEEE